VASRITVEYQYALTRFRRNLAMLASEWKRGGWSWFVQGCPRRTTPAGRSRALDATDRVALAHAGDSLALGAGVTPGVGDYDTVRVAAQAFFAFAGIDSGSFAVRFARVGDGRGDYADSGIVAGRSVYRFVEWAVAPFASGGCCPRQVTPARIAGIHARLRRDPDRRGGGGFVVRSQHAVLARRPRRRGRRGARERVERGPASRPAGRAGIGAAFRSVERRFTPFSRLERPFAEEDWGLPVAPISSTSGAAR